MPAFMRRESDGSTSIGGNAAPVELPRQHELAFGDVAREIRNRMSDVVVRHGQYWDLSHRSRTILQYAGALEQRGKVTVHVTGESSAAGDLLPCRRDLAERLAVVGNIRHDHEYMHPGLEGQELGLGQSNPGSLETLDRRISGLVQVQDASLHRPAPLDTVDEGVGLARGDPDPDEQHGKRFPLRRPGSCDDLRRQFQGGETGSREDRQFLSPHQGIHPVDGRDPGFDEDGRR